MAFGRRETAILILGDLLILIASLWMALLLRNLSLPTFGYFEANLIPFLPVFLLSLVVFYISGLYEKQTRPIRRVMSARVFGAQVANVIIAAIIFFILPLSIAPKTILILYLVVSVIAEALWRVYRMKSEMKESNRVPALLIGSGPAVLELYDEVNDNSRYLIRFRSRVETAGLSDDAILAAVSESIASGARAIVVDTANPVVARLVPTVYGLLATGGITFIEFSALYEEIFDRVPLHHLAASRLIETLPRHRLLYDIAKRAFDIVLALLAAVIAIPFILVAILLLSFQGGTPIIRNERIGKNGRTFHIIKLRSMLLNDHGDPELQKKNRVTALGRILRKTRIDELPQLWNVLVGELSFIGPRPELPKIAEIYEKEIPQYRTRYLIAPGLSGWAQIHDFDAPRGPADIERTERKLSFDLYYVKHRSFGLDFAIALKTLRALFSLSGT
jgi:lipopolysaccharide/colanic/teichoic acid biosynthesis glycosyltransferase